MKFLKWIIRKLVILYYRIEPFYVYTWGVDEHLDLSIYSEEYYDDYHRFGTREEHWKNELVIDKVKKEEEK